MSEKTFNYALLVKQLKRSAVLKKGEDPLQAGLMQLRAIIEFFDQGEGIDADTLLPIRRVLRELHNLQQGGKPTFGPDVHTRPANTLDSFLKMNLAAAVSVLHKAGALPVIAAATYVAREVNRLRLTNKTIKPTQLEEIYRNAIADAWPPPRDKALYFQKLQDRQERITDLAGARREVDSLLQHVKQSAASVPVRIGR
jgi:hypothetical protein